MTFTSEFDKRIKRRLSNQIQRLDAEINFKYYTAIDLSKSFREKHSSILNKKHQGFGYYIWKPQIILQSLEKLSENDILVYLDAGAHVNHLGKKTFNDIVRELKSSRTYDLFLYNGAPSQRLRDTYPSKSFVNFQNNLWTAGNVLSKYSDPKEAALRHQFFSGLLIIKNTEGTRRIIRSWLQNCEDYNFLIGQNVPKNRDLIRHQLDMACLNLTLDRVQAIGTRSYDEIWLPSKRTPHFNEKALQFSPFWMKRDYGIFRQLKYNLKNIFRLFCNF